MIEIMNPKSIEKKSFEIIEELLDGKKFPLEQEAIIKRCIHTSADFEYAESLYFSDKVVQRISEALKKGCRIVTDTQMAKSGINKKAAQKWGVEIECFISDDFVVNEAEKKGITRSAVAIEYALSQNKPTLFVIGNAPTALIRLEQLYKENMNVVGVIAVPVGFVNVVESKELIMKTSLAQIVAQGRKGGSNIAAAICNALLYRL